jgi:nucleotide-binding universal stress UspA family protein
MFRHILVPTDGSRLAAKGIKAAARLAKALGAKLTGVYVIPPYMPPMYGEGSAYVPVLTPAQYKKQALKGARKALAVVEIEAQTARVPCRTVAREANRPWEGILRAARGARCDLVVMASHGRGAFGGLLLGSETTRVLAHSKIPVLVCR